MNIIGCVMFFFAGILAIKFSRFFNEEGLNDYSNCPRAFGSVSHTHDFGGERWLVYFRDADGIERMGLDDLMAESSFSHKYKQPVFGSEEYVYYYPIPERHSYSINGEKIMYYIHFCNDDLYELQRHVVKKRIVAGHIFGVVLWICAFLILMFG